MGNHIGSFGSPTIDPTNNRSDMDYAKLRLIEQNWFANIFGAGNTALLELTRYKAAKSTGSVGIFSNPVGVISSIYRPLHSSLSITNSLLDTHCAILQQDRSTFATRLEYRLQFGKGSGSSNPMSELSNAKSLSCLNKSSFFNKENFPHPVTSHRQY